MSKQQPPEKGMGLPLEAMILMSLLSAVIVGFSFVVIKYWPLPASVSPYMGFNGGFCWGLVVGAISGFVLGYLVDETHFAD